MLTLQMIRIMNKIWVQEGLDMRMVIFRCFSTGRGRGQLGIGGGGCAQAAGMKGTPLLYCSFAHSPTWAVCFSRKVKMDKMISIEAMEGH